MSISAAVLAFPCYKKRAPWTLLVFPVWCLQLSLLSYDGINTCLIVLRYWVALPVLYYVGSHCHASCTIMSSKHRRERIKAMFFPCMLREREEDGMFCTQIYPWSKTVMFGCCFVCYSTSGNVAIVISYLSSSICTLK